MHVLVREHLEKTADEMRSHIRIHEEQSLEREQALAHATADLDRETAARAAHVRRKKKTATDEERAEHEAVLSSHDERIAEHQARVDWHAGDEGSIARAAAGADRFRDLLAAIEEELGAE